MAGRLGQFSLEITGGKVPHHVESSFDYLELSSQLTTEENVPNVQGVGNQAQGSRMGGEGGEASYHPVCRRSQVPATPTGKAEVAQHL